MRKAVPRDGFFYTLSVMKKKTKAVDKKVVPLGLWLSLGIALGASVGYAQVEKK